MKPDKSALRIAVRIAGVLGVLLVVGMGVSLVRAVGAVLFVGLGVYWSETRDWGALSPKQMAGVSALVLAFWAGLIFIGRKEPIDWFIWILLAAIISLPAALLAGSLLEWRAARRSERNGA